VEWHECMRGGKARGSLVEVQQALNLSSHLRAPRSQTTLKLAFHGRQGALQLVPLPLQAGRLRRQAVGPLMGVVRS